ncbi:MFS transporter [Paraburkholderia sp. BR14320]
MPTFCENPPVEAAHMMTKRAAATVVIANALEFFDYFSYATFIAFINKAFFPHSGNAVGMVYSFGIFAAGFLARPLGAILIGMHADSAGRKPALLLTSLLITVGTLGVAAVPGYSTIGLAAPTLVLLCRLVQGVAIGGEMGVSASLMMESCPPQRQSWYAGWLMAGQGLALIASGLCGMAISQMLPPAEVERWGWRLPFALATAIVPLQYLLRRHIKEDWRKPTTVLPVRTYTSGHGKQWLIALLLIFGGTVPTYMAAYTAAFGVGGAIPTAKLTATATMLVGLISVVASVAGGWLADHFGNSRIIAVSRVMTMIVVFPAFRFAASAGSDSSLLAAIMLFAGLSMAGGGPAIVEILSMFPERQRALSLSLVYSVGVALFGGTAPLIVASVSLWAGSHYAPTWYILLACVASLFALLLLAGSRSESAIHPAQTN